MMDGGPPASTMSDKDLFTDADFRRIAQIALRDFGLSLQDSKKSLVSSRLGRRLRALGLDSFSAYIDLVESPAGAEEKVLLLSTLTTNVTRFFREGHHFDHLRDQVLPDLVARARAGGRVRLWSAGCSSGEEVYSMAMVVHAADPGLARTNTKILATDIDPAILRKARDGRYDLDALEDIPKPYHDSLRIDRAAGQFTLAPEVAQLITFGETNLVAQLPVSGPFDVIFCRNVAIYFDKPTQALVWEKFARLLAPGGILYIGHSERLSGPAMQMMTNAGITTYKKAQETVR